MMAVNPSDRLPPCEVDSQSSETATQRHFRHMAKESIVGVEAAAVRELYRRTYGYMNGGDRAADEPIGWMDEVLESQ